MSSLDLHPDELLERDQRDVLTEVERERLEEHLADCAVCRFERSVRDDFEQEAAPQGDDEELLSDVLAATFAEHQAAKRRIEREPPLQRRGGRRAAYVALAVSLVALVAAAAALLGRFGTPRLESLRPALPRPPVLVVTPAPESPPAADDGTDRETEVADVDEDTKDAAAAEGPSAAELFERANRERRGGSPQEAARLYRTLQQRYPSSREAGASRLALARLLLDRLGDPAGALRLFNGYLAAGGTLQQEALLGRAMALGRMGRTAQEKAAWEQLLARYPNSVHAERARKRLERLR